MGRVRATSRVMSAAATTEGAGVRVRRVFGQPQAQLLDPFLLLDEVRAADPAELRGGFPWHPHRGLETITWVLAGRFEHEDSLGNAGALGPGDVHWVTSGGGVLHQEMPRVEGASEVHLLQLWLNMPAAHKLAAPRHREVRAVEIPEVRPPGGARVRLLAGEVADVRGPVRDVASAPTVLDVVLPAAGSLALPVPRGWTVFAYVLAGALREAEGPLAAGHGALLGDGDEVDLDAGGDGARVLLIAARPLGEPIAWWGPIVMSSEEELRAAIQDYHDDTFVGRRR
jgi:redox-sensitive bicupin YhaK (pirin superfamily)